MNRMLTNAFLRLYGFNLGRKFRNAPDQACVDAVMQMIMVCVIPVGLGLALLAAFLPENHAAIRFRNLPFMLFAVGFVLPVTLWMGKQFVHYKHTPDAANSFRSVRERRKSMVIFVLVVILFVATAGLISYGLR